MADTRIHGTTRKQVKKAFEQTERGALLPIPVERFPFFVESQRKVNRDGHVEVDKAYYSVPPEYLGRRVWVRWDSRVVRVFDQRMKQIAFHVKREPGRFSTQSRHIPRQKRSGIERGATYLLDKASLIGPRTEHWAEQMIQQRGIQGVRVLMGLLGLSNPQVPSWASDLINPTPFMFTGPAVPLGTIIVDAAATRPNLFFVDILDGIGGGDSILDGDHVYRATFRTGRFDLLVLASAQFPHTNFSNRQRVMVALPAQRSL